MKRLLITALLSTAAIFTTTVNAASSSFYVDTKPAKFSLNEKMLHPFIDITVINASSSPFYFVVPGTPINVFFNPGSPNYHIHGGDTGSYYTPLVLQDVYHNTFYSFNLCPLTIVTVTGYTGHFSYNTDTDLCS